MRRYSLTLVLVAVLSAWAGGQSAAPPPGGPERVRLLHANAALVEQLVAHGVKLSGGSALDQVSECRGAVATLGRALAACAENPDPDASRLIDLSEQVVQLVRTGLAPALEKAREQVPPGSPGAERLKQIEDQTAGELGACRGLLPTTGRLGALPQLAEAREKLGALPGALAATK